MLAFIIPTDGMVVGRGLEGAELASFLKQKSKIRPG